VGVEPARHLFEAARRAADTRHRHASRRSRALRNLTQGITCDEPCYLLVAHSLAFDGDLDLTNNLRDRDFWTFYGRDLATEGAVTTSDGGRSYAVHEVGFPLLLSLPYRLGGKPLALLALYPIAVLPALNVYWLAWEETASAELAWRSWASVFTTAPVLLYTFQFYPEIVAATIRLTVPVFILCASEQVRALAASLGVYR